MDAVELRAQAVMLRKLGMTYPEIVAALDFKVPKSTLSGWLSKIELDENALAIIENKRLLGNTIARSAAVTAKRQNREQYLSTLDSQNSYLAGLVTDKDTSRVALAMLYLGEGSKNSKGALYFGNSNPQVISLFLHLLRTCYEIHESKFRGTVQCRADQDIDKLELFWETVSKIPRSQFYAARIDKRSIGQVTQKENYMGVFRIDYFSSQVYYDILSSINQVLRAVSSVG